MTEITLNEPPHDTKAERFVLGSAIANNKLLETISHYLYPDDFYHIAHQKIYGAILELYGKNEPIDLFTLANKLKERNNFEEIGNKSYFANLVDNITVKDFKNVKLLLLIEIRIILDLKLRRNIIQAATKLIHDVYNKKTNVKKLLNIFDINSSSMCGRLDSFYHNNHNTCRNPNICN